MVKKFLYVALIIGLLFFSGNQFLVLKTYKMQLEAGYQRAFHELTTYMDGLENELLKFQIANSLEQKLGSLANVQRFIYSSQANLGQLPIGGLDLSKIDNLLAKVQLQVAQSAKELCRYGICQEVNQINQLYEQVSLLNRRLQSDLNSHVDKTIWVKWKQYLQTLVIHSSNIAPGPDYPMLQSLWMINKDLSELDDIDKDNINRFKIPIEVTQKVFLIDQNQAIDAAQKFLQEIAVGRELKVNNKPENQSDSYTIEAMAQKPGLAPISLEVDARDGHVLWMVNSRQVKENRLSLEELISEGEIFLNTRGFPTTELLGLELMHNRVILDYTVAQEGVLILPKQFKLQVACDNGEIVGFNSFAYHSFKHTGQLTPTLSLEQAKTYLSSDVTITGGQLALILDTNLREVLTYRFLVKYGEKGFIVYINAKCGSEERIEPL